MSDYPETRPNIVAALAGITDPTDLSETELAALAEATEAEVREATRAHALAVLEHWTDAGVLRRTTTLDLSLRAVVAVAAVGRELGPEWLKPEHLEKKLGDVLKVADPQAAGIVAAFLRWGGLLPDELPDDPVVPDD